MKKTNAISLAVFSVIMMQTHPLSAEEKPANPAPAAMESKEQRDTRLAWWREARFGMFVHWGLYSGLAGNWKGKAMATPGYPNTEWMQHMAGADTKSYAAEAVPKFKPTADFAKAWARLAKQAGCQYVVFTTKHHEGFALHDSKFSDFDAGDVLNRDLVKEITDALHEEGLKVGFYHSVIDWHHADYDFKKAVGLPYPTAANQDAPPRDHTRYIDFLHNQVDELTSNYGKVDILWWDFSSKDFQGAAAWRSTELMKKIRAKQPGAIMNNRLFRIPEAGFTGAGTGDVVNRLDPQYGDFVTPEQHIPPNGLPGVDWESCMTLNKTWGYNESDHAWKSSCEIIRNLIDIASKGGNYLLNIGPKGDGTIPEATVTCMTEVGKWMDVNAEAIRGTTATPFGNLAWGRCTTKNREGGTTLFLHVFEWPKDGKLVVPGLKNTVSSALLLACGEKLTFERKGEDVLVNLPATAPDANASVIKMEIQGAPDVVQIVALKGSMTASSTWSVPGFEAEKANDDNSKSRWSGAEGTRSGWLEIDLGTEMSVGRALIRETSFPRTEEFVLEYLDGDVWKEITKGSAIAGEKMIPFSPVKARRFRLNILKASNVPTIEEFVLNAN